MIYLDASAIVKLVRSEAGSAELTTWIAARPTSALASSVLAEVEVVRALRRHEPAALAGVPAVLSKLYRVEIDAGVRAAAAEYADPSLRCLDAIHLATAQTLAAQPSETLDAFVTYDDRLLSAALALAMNTASPGRT